MFRRDVKPLANIVLQCLRHDGLETPLLQRRLKDSWDAVAGQAVARYTGDKFIKNQVLFVKILSPALRADLSMMREDFLRRLNAAAGSRVITEVRFY